MPGAVETTVIGAFPKPAYVDIPDWFSGTTSNISEQYNERIEKLKDPTEAAKYDDMISRGLKEVISAQESFGIDVPTDGEIRRENYIYAFLRQLDGIDWKLFTPKVCRNGAYTCDLPTIVSQLSTRDSEAFVAKEWMESKKHATRPLKITIPGPMTICDTISNKHYESEKALCDDMVKVINREVLALVKSGCKYIQIDEPLFARMPEKALEYGIDNVNACFEGVPADVEKIVHICCGYPNHLDDVDYEKAPPSAYFRLADAMDAAPNVDTVSIEDAHRHNDLSLLEHFTKTKVIFGVVAVACSRIESVDEVKSRLSEALKHLPATRLIAAPDCGLGLLPRDILRQKLENMCEAVRQLNAEASQ
eukprot:GFYU01010965.1.p1 GENE.GFYU01010965.1~~GFYU01010965.1.p1  ORF type:complete len:363 (+),score=124.68 GFYU01010965.1:100-1188(+)